MEMAEIVGTEEEPVGGSAAEPVGGIKAAHQIAKAVVKETIEGLKD